jgi:hypothetical protein
VLEPRTRAPVRRVFFRQLYSDQALLLRARAASSHEGWRHRAQREYVTDGVQELGRERDVCRAAQAYIPRLSCGRTLRRSGRGRERNEGGRCPVGGPRVSLDDASASPCAPQGGKNSADICIHAGAASGDYSQSRAPNGRGRGEGGGERGGRCMCALYRLDLSQHPCDGVRPRRRGAPAAVGRRSFPRCKQKGNAQIGG